MSALLERYGFPLRLALAGIVLTAAAEHVAPLRALMELLDRHRQPLLAVTIGAAVLGFLLFMGGILHLVMTSGEAMTHAEVEAQQHGVRDTAAQPYVARRSIYRFRGKTAGRQTHVEMSFADVKRAWAARAWRDDVRWRCIFAAIAGGLLLSFGLLGTVVVIAPPFVRFVVLSAMAYALVRTAWGFRQA